MARSKGWKFEPARHSLAAKGIETAGIGLPSPIAVQKNFSRKILEEAEKPGYGGADYDGKIGVHQAILNIAYDRWQQKRGSSMESWFGSLTSLERGAVALGKMNQQVQNGGFMQWEDNGYMEVMSDDAVAVLRSMPKTKETKEAIDLIHEYREMSEDIKGGSRRPSDDYESAEDSERELMDKSDDLDGRYYKIEADLMKQAENYFTKIVKSGIW